MAIRFGDRVYDTTETTGQGPFTLSDVAVPTFQRPSAFFANGDRFIGYLGHAPNPSDPPPNEWIVALFEYASAGPTVAVVEIYDGSSGTSAVSFSPGVKQVYSAPNAGRPGVKVSDGKDADARPANPVVNDLYVVTDTGAVQRYDGSSWVTIATSNTGTVTSVGLTMPNLFAVDKSPVTTSGTIAVTLSSQTKATFLAAPTASDGAPTFRVIAAGDLPSTVALTDKANTFAKNQTFQGRLVGTSGNYLDLNVTKDFFPEAYFSHVNVRFEANIFAGTASYSPTFAGVDGFDFFVHGFSNGSLGYSYTADILSQQTFLRFHPTMDWDGKGAPGLYFVSYTGAKPADGYTPADKASVILHAGGITLASGAVFSGDGSGLTDLSVSWGNLVSVPANVDAFGNLVSVTDSLPYFTDSGKMALATFTSFARDLLDDADAATARGTLGVNNPILTIDLPNGTYTILRSARHAFTINTAYGAVASAGSGTLTVSINGTPVTGLNAAVVTTTPADLTATAANTVGVGNVVTVTVAGLAANETIAATIQGTRT